MNNGMRKTKDYFVLVKFILLLGLIGFYVVNGSGSLVEKAIQIFMGALFIVFAVWSEWNRKIVFIAMEGILAVLAVFLFPVVGIYLLLISLFDWISNREWPMWYFLCGYLVLVLCIRQGMDVVVSFGAVTFLIIIYVQEKVILRGYRQVLQESEENEGQLKMDMEREKKDHSDALRKSQLGYENEMLQERDRIAQAMHDKLGHSINGSLYQLEAAKLLASKKPKECEDILQEVINQLRVSMDEIRVILRRERPNKKRMAVLSLQSLCDECQDKYNIRAELNLSGDSERIPETIWEIILDNTFEAVTNSLKYAKCQHIVITIAVLNQVVRCTIEDDGIGAENVEEGMGIAGMKKRVREVRGFLDIETEIGFRINMILPVE